MTKKTTNSGSGGMRPNSFYLGTKSEKIKSFRCCYIFLFINLNIVNKTIQNENLYKSLNPLPAIPNNADKRE